MDYPSYAEVELVPEEVEGQCTGCVFEEAEYDACPKNKDRKLVCASYTPGPPGIYKEVTDERHKY